MISEEKYIELVTRLRKEHDYFRKLQRKILNEPEGEIKNVKFELMNLVLNRTSEIVNWWNNLEAKELNREKHRKEMERAQQKKERKAEAEKYFAEMEKPKAPEKNTTCRYYCENHLGEISCSIGMDTTYCSKRCAFASNMVSSTRVYDAPVIENNRRVGRRND